MQKLNVRFNDETKEKITDDAAFYEVTSSDLARAAMVAGLYWLEQKQAVTTKAQFRDIIKNNQVK